MIEQFLNSLPEDWVWTVEQPKLKTMVKIDREGKRPKLVPLRYTSYISNGKDIGSEFFISAFGDANNYNDAIKQAFDALQAKAHEKAREKIADRRKKDPKVKDSVLLKLYEQTLVNCGIK